MQSEECRGFAAKPGRVAVEEDAASAKADRSARLESAKKLGRSLFGFLVPPTQLDQRCSSHKPHFLQSVAKKTWAPIRRPRLEEGHLLACAVHAFVDEDLDLDTTIVGA